MRYIQKKTPPREFTDYCQLPCANFDDLTHNHYQDIKPTLKKSLLEEQGYICCYCGRRIQQKGSHIDHLFPKSNPLFAHLELDYSNLLCSCDGSENERNKYPRPMLHCDPGKRCKILKTTPLMHNCEEQFLYEATGEITAFTPDAEATICALHLDAPQIKNWRAAAIAAYAILPDLAWEDEYERLNIPDENGMLEPFCFALRCYIKHFILQKVI